MSYEKDKCTFNFPGCLKKGAAYQRKDENGEFKDACEKCARKPYEKKGDQNEEQS
jgi:hypothetical protein